MYEVMRKCNNKQSVPTVKNVTALTEDNTAHNKCRWLINTTWTCTNSTVCVTQSSLFCPHVCSGIKLMKKGEFLTLQRNLSNVDVCPCEQRFQLQQWKHCSLKNIWLCEIYVLETNN